MTKCIDWFTRRGRWKTQLTNREKELMMQLHTTKCLLRHVCERCPGWEALVDEDRAEEIRKAARLKPEWLMHNGYKYVLEENSNA